MTTVILALDLGKFNSVLCWFDPETRKAEFRTVRSSAADLRPELTRLAVQQIVFEACSQAGWVHDLCEELKLPTLVASTTGSAWQWKRVKRKTDRDDALKLARMAAVGEIDGVPVSPRSVRQWKSLIGFRKRLVSERVRIQNRIRGLLVCQGLPAPIGPTSSPLDWTARRARSPHNPTRSTLVYEPASATADGRTRPPRRPDDRAITELQPMRQRREHERTRVSIPAADPRTTPSPRFDAGIEFADLNSRFVGTERFLRRRGYTAAAAGPEGVAAEPRKAVWRRTGDPGVDARTRTIPALRQTR